tara:strand:- start:4818 stop:5747 length:930 start_codon:yes stop_codon:yes gene_type:complete
MKTLIFGLGNQGQKRAKYFKKKDYISYDKFNKQAEIIKFDKIPFNKINSVFLCLPDKEKLNSINIFLEKGKNILVEKPFLISRKIFKNIKKKIIEKKIIFYVAYNHRFEPHIINLKKIIKKKELGKIYYVKIFYGNGTSLLVKKSPWKDSGNGVVSDLGSHVVDLIFFLFGNQKVDFTMDSINKFENNSIDHAIFSSKKSQIKFFCEATLLMWKNSFNLDVIGEKGSAHINGLCKWGPSTLEIRKRKLPSGKPKIKIKKIKMKDPTWKLEHIFFEKLIKSKNLLSSINNLEKEYLISKKINQIVKKISK